jgi:hypothetical protein
MKVLSPFGEAEVDDAYAMAIRRARYLREKGERVEGMLGYRFSEGVHEGPSVEHQKHLKEFLAAVDARRIAHGGRLSARAIIPESMYPRLPYVVFHVFNGIAEDGPSSDALAGYGNFVPAMLGLSEREAIKVAAAVVRALSRYEPGSWWELVWCLAVQQTRKEKRGQKPKWIGMDGILLVEDVELQLQKMRLGRKRKGLERAIDAVRVENPRWYGKFSEDRLRRAYYEALPHRDTLKATLRGKS